MKKKLLQMFFGIHNFFLFCFVCLFHLLDKYAGCLYTFVVVVDVFLLCKKRNKLHRQVWHFLMIFSFCFSSRKKHWFKNLMQPKKQCEKTKISQRKMKNHTLRDREKHDQRETIITKLNEWIKERTKFFCYIPFNFDLPLVIHIWMDQCKKQKQQKCKSTQG